MINVLHVCEVLHIEGEGASSGNDFCHAESAPITSPTFWQFDIWDPAASSTTASTTTAPTTHTVTTRPVSISTIQLNLTTTGIVRTTPTTHTTTTAVPTTTHTTTTVTTVTTATTISLQTDVPVMTAKQFEEACIQPVIIGTVASMLFILPVNFIAMFALFIHLNNAFNPHQLMLKHRRKLFSQRISRRNILIEY